MYLFPICFLPMIYFNPHFFSIFLYTPLSEPLPGVASRVLGLGAVAWALLPSGGPAGGSLKDRAHPHGPFQPGAFHTPVH